MRTLFLKKWGRKAAVEVSLVFVTDSQIRKLNERYRHKNKATDVLSFPMNVKDKRAKLLGDIVISADTAKRDAKKKGIRFEEELKFLLIHGFLHLLGYDHEISEREKKRMERKERQYAKFLGGI